MQSPSAVLNIGAEVAKDAIVVACSEGSFPVREVANQRPAVLAFSRACPPAAASVWNPPAPIMSCSLRLPTSSDSGSSCSIPRTPTNMPRPLDCGARPIAWMPSSSRA